MLSSYILVPYAPIACDVAQTIQLCPRHSTMQQHSGRETPQRNNRQPGPPQHIQEEHVEQTEATELGQNSLLGPTTSQPATQRYQWVATLSGGLKLTLMTSQSRLPASLTMNGKG